MSIITTTIFNIYTYILAYICLYTIDEGVKIGGKLLKDIRFVDDQAMVASGKRTTGDNGQISGSRKKV